MPEPINPLLKTLRSKQPAFGGNVTLPGTGLARCVARVKGISWIFVDGEHGLLSDSNLFETINAITQCGVSPIVRVPAHDHHLTARALDAGAHGIVVPFVETAEQAQTIVRASKFPPLGSRGYGSIYSCSAFGVDSPDYVKHANEYTLIFAQIESPLGVKNLEEIVKTPGLAGVTIGPTDLSMTMGVAKGSKEHEEAISYILKTAKAAGKYVGLFSNGGEVAKNRATQGFDMVRIVSDNASLTNYLAMELGVAQGKSQAEIDESLKQYSL